MNHEIIISCKDEALPRLMGFLLGQGGGPDDKYAWSKDGRFTGQHGITWGFEPDELEERSFKVGCYNTGDYASISDAAASGAIYICSNTLDGRSQAYDARSVMDVVAECLGGEVKVIFGLSGGDAWPTTK